MNVLSEFLENNNRIEFRNHLVTVKFNLIAVFNFLLKFKDSQITNVSCHMYQNCTKFDCT